MRIGAPLTHTSGVTMCTDTDTESEEPDDEPVMTPRGSATPGEKKGVRWGESYVLAGIALLCLEVVCLDTNTPLLCSRVAPDQVSVHSMSSKHSIASTRTRRLKISPEVQAMVHAAVVIVCGLAILPYDV